MELFMKAKLYQGLNRVQRLLGSLESFKKVGYIIEHEFYSQVDDIVDWLEPTNI